MAINISMSVESVLQHRYNLALRKDKTVKASRILRELHRNREPRKIFHSCYYINLDRATSRRSLMEVQYQNLTRIEAVDGNTLEGNEYMSKYEIACVWSHIKAIQTAYDNGLDEVLILEDDIYIDYVDKWSKTIRSIIDSAPLDMECIQFHCSNPVNLYTMIKTNSDFIPWNQLSWSTGCYYLNRKGMSRILSLEINSLLNKLFDDTIEGRHTADFVLYKYLNCYTYTNLLFNHQVSESIIHPSHLHSHTEALKIIQNYFGTIEIQENLTDFELRHRYNIALKKDKTVKASRILRELHRNRDPRDVFHSCYYINLNRATSRKTIMECQYKNLTRIEAVDGNTLADNDYLSKYEIACVLSHVKAIQTAYDNGLDEVLILEDDIYIDYFDKWSKTLESIIASAPLDMECIQFHCINPLNVSRMIKVNRDFIRWNVTNSSAGCYYLNRKGMSRILSLDIEKSLLNTVFMEDTNKNKIYKKEGWPHVSDILLYNYINSYTYTNPLFNHQVTESFIHPSHLSFHIKVLKVIQQYFGYYDEK